MAALWSRLPAVGALARETSVSCSRALRIMNAHCRCEAGVAQGVYIPRIG